MNFFTSDASVSSISSSVYRDVLDCSKARCDVLTVVFAVLVALKA